MRIVKYWQCQPCGTAVTPLGKTRKSLHNVPAIILASVAAGGLEVDLLPAILAYVPDIQVIRNSIERKSPGIAQAQRPDFRTVSRLTHKRVIRRDRVSRAIAHRHERQI